MESYDIFRLLFLFVLFLVAFISGIFLRRAGESGGQVNRTAEAAVIRLLRPVLGLPFVTGALAYIFSPGLLAWSEFAVSRPLRWVFTAAAFLCVLCMVSVFKNLGSNVTTTILPRKRPSLVTSGPYRMVRHPLYAVALALAGCLSIVAASGFLLAWVLAAVPVFRYIVIPKEEENLVRVFGAEYETYRRSTGAIFPKLFR